LEISLIENIQRRDLNAIETAVAYAKLRDQFNLTNEKIAQRVHKSVSAVVNTMRLLKLPKEIVALIAEGKLSEGQARPLIGQDEAVILEITPRIITENWSARKVEQHIVNLKKSHNNDEKQTNDTTSRDENPHEARIETLRTRLNAKVAIRTNTKGAGKIVIEFKNQEDLDRIQGLLGD
jgi:ParB family chromosome partitioning protein